MDRRAIESYIIRAVTAQSVRELHDIAQSARRAHPGDVADVDVIDRVCWAAVSQLFAEHQSRARGPARSTPRGPAGRLVRTRQRRDPDELFDWKARAAGN